MRTILVITGIFGVPMGLLFTWMTYQSAGQVMRGDLRTTLVMLGIAWTIPIAMGIAMGVAANKALKKFRATGEASTVPIPVPQTVGGKLWRVTWVSLVAAVACFLAITAGPKVHLGPYDPGPLQGRLIASAELGLGCFLILLILAFVIPLLPSKRLWTEPGDPPSSGN